MVILQKNNNQAAVNWLHFSSHIKQNTAFMHSKHSTSCTTNGSSPLFQKHRNYISFAPTMTRGANITGKLIFLLYVLTLKIKGYLNPATSNANLLGLSLFKILILRKHNKEFLFKGTEERRSSTPEKFFPNRKITLSRFLDIRLVRTNPYRSWPPIVFIHPLFDHHHHRWDLGFSFAWPLSKDQLLDPLWSPRWLGSKTCDMEGFHNTQVPSFSPKSWKMKDRLTQVQNCTFSQL